MSGKLACLFLVNLPWIISKLFISLDFRLLWILHLLYSFLRQFEWYIAPTATISLSLTLASNFVSTSLCVIFLTQTSMWSVWSWWSKLSLAVWLQKKIFPVILLALPLLRKERDVSHVLLSAEVSVDDLKRCSLWLSYLVVQVLCKIALCLTRDNARLFYVS